MGRTLESRLRARVAVFVLPALVLVGAAAVVITSRILASADRATARHRAEQLAVAMTDELAEGDDFGKAAGEVLGPLEREGARGVVRARGEERGSHGVAARERAVAPRECLTTRDDAGTWTACDVRWATPILAQVARALAAMHGRGIVHRDLKPSNILLDGTHVKVTDFGIAGLVGDDPFAATVAASAVVDSPELTRSGAILGTPLYMAPELAHGARAAGPAADVFSFGVVAYELLAAKLPHAAPPVLERLAGRALPSPISFDSTNHDVTRELGTLVIRCLAEAPDARPTADAVASMLDAIASR